MQKLHEEVYHKRRKSYMLDIGTGALSWGDFDPSKSWAVRVFRACWYIQGLSVYLGASEKPSFHYNPPVKVLFSPMAGHHFQGVKNWSLYHIDTVSLINRVFSYKWFDLGLNMGLTSMTSCWPQFGIKVASNDHGLVLYIWASSSCVFVHIDAIPLLHWLFIMS